MLRDKKEFGARSLALCVVLLAAILVPSADAHVYWSNPSKGAIGRANLDGSVFDPDFIFSPGVGDVAPLGVAVSPSHVYWMTGESEDPATDAVTPATMWRANLSGQGIESVLSGSSLGDDPGDLAIRDDYVYWASWSGGIYRARLDGSEAEKLLPIGVAGIAVSASRIYWSRWPGMSSSIGRANLDGSEPNEDFITGLDATAALAVDSSHLYWYSWPGKIGRSELDGSERDDDYIPSTGGSGNGLAVDSAHIYFSVGDNPVGSIGRVNLDGTGLNTALITPISEPGAIALDGGYSTPPSPMPKTEEPPGPPSNKFRIGRFVLDRDKGTAKMMVGVAGPGTLEVSGKAVRRVIKRPARRSKVAMPVVLRGNAKRRLRRSGEVQILVRIAFTPTGGSRNSEWRSWSLAFHRREHRKSWSA